VKAQAGFFICTIFKLFFEDLTYLKPLNRVFADLVPGWLIWIGMGGLKGLRLNPVGFADFDGDGRTDGQWREMADLMALPAKAQRMTAAPSGACLQMTVGLWWKFLSLR
jgi:hypothetical protein